MFISDVRESIDSVVLIYEISKDVMEILFEYIYSGKINLINENI